MFSAYPFVLITSHRAADVPDTVTGMVSIELSNEYESSEGTVSFRTVGVKGSANEYAAMRTSARMHKSFFMTVTP